LKRLYILWRTLFRHVSEQYAYNLNKKRQNCGGI